MNLCNLSMSHSLLKTRQIVYRDDLRSRYWIECPEFPGQYVSCNVHGNGRLSSCQFAQSVPEFDTLTTKAIRIL